MPTGKDVNSVVGDRAKSDADELGFPDADHQPAGRVIHDGRGNAVWKWVGDTATSGTGSGILKHLDPADLKIEVQHDQLVTPREVTGRAKSKAALERAEAYRPYLEWCCINRVYGGQTRSTVNVLRDMAPSRS